MKLLKGLLVGAALASAVVIASRVAMRMKDNSQTVDRNSREVTKEPSQYTGIIEDVLELIEDKDCRCVRLLKRLLKRNTDTKRLLPVRRGLEYSRKQTWEIWGRFSICPID